MVYDPFLSAERIESLNAEKSSLEDVLKYSDFYFAITSNENTKNIINLKQIKKNEKNILYS